MIGTLALLLLLWVLAGAAVFAWGTWTPRPGSRRLVRTASARVARVGDPVEVRLWPAAPGVPARRGPPEPRRVVLVLDHSSSMGGGPGSPLEHARLAAISFVRSVASELCPVGVVAFDDTARTAHPLSPAVPPLRDALRGIASGGGTDIAAGLRHARTLLAERGAGSGVVVLLSDGGSAAEPALAEAKLLREAGVRVVALGLGAAVNHDLLRGIASSPDDYLHVLRAEGLARLYNTVRDSIAGEGGYRADLREQSDTASVLLSSTGEFAPWEVDLYEGVLRWFIPFVPRAGEMEVSYTVRPLRCGWYRVAPRPARLEMRDGEGVPHAGESNRTPYLLVLPRAGWPLSGLLLNPLWWMLAGRLRRGRGAGYSVPPLPAPAPLPLPAVQTPEAEPRVRRLGPLYPVLVVGAGHAGGLVLRALRHHLDQLSPPAEGQPRVLYVETGATPVSGVHEESPGPPLDPAECVFLDGDLYPVFQGLEGGAGDDAWGGMQPDTLRPDDYNLSTGTHGRRVLGRAALRHHLRGPDAALPVRIDAALAALGPERRVVVVSSTSGGTGGGMLPDLLRLVRERIDASDAHARVDLLLLSHRAVEGPEPEPVRVLNSGALLAEVGRLAYRDAPGETAPARRLVDRVLLLEAPLEPEGGTGRLALAAHAGAEVILHLAAAPREGVDAWLESRTPQVRALQRECGQTLLYGVGAALRYLPVRRARTVAAREAAAARLRELAGWPAGGQAPPLPAPVPGIGDSDGGEGAPFLLAALPEPGAPVPLGALLGGVTEYPGTGGIPFAFGGDMVSARSLGVQQSAFDQWLAGWAHRALQPAEGDAGPAPGLAQLAEGVGRLGARVAAAAEALRSGALPEGWGAEDRARMDFVVHLLSRYGHSLHLFRRHLEGWTEVLVGTGRTGGALAAAVTGAGRAREAMDREIQDLRPFAHWPPELEERWTHAAAQARRTASARWGAWGVHAGRDGAPPELVLVLPGEPALSLVEARADAEGMAARLEAVAGDAFPPLPPLREALDRDRWLAPDHRGDPLAVVQERQARWTATHAAPREFGLLGGRAADLASADGGGADADPRVDPHRASVVRVVEPCALSATGTWLDAEARVGGGPAGGLPLLNPVERRAAACEERFPHHGLTRPVFSPAVRVYFAAPQRLRDLLLAVAFGCVRPRLGRREHVLFLGNDPLTAEGGASEPLLLEAMDSYVLAGGTAEPRRPLDTDAVHAQVQAALGALDADGARALPGQAEAAVRALAAGCPPPVIDQLAALARFFATVAD
jgi:Mg-chelatase subunit ChlD